MVLATLMAISPFVFSIFTFPFVVFAASLPCKAQSLKVKTVVFEKRFPYLTPLICIWDVRNCWFDDGLHQAFADRFNFVKSWKFFFLRLLFALDGVCLTFDSSCNFLSVKNALNEIRNIETYNSNPDILIAFTLTRIATVTADNFIDGLVCIWYIAGSVFVTQHLKLSQFRWEWKELTAFSTAFSCWICRLIRCAASLVSGRIQ